MQLWLVGEGPERNKLVQQISASPAHSRIHLLGAQTDIPALLARSDIFVLPPLIEGMSNALLEAMAAGLPCITSDLPVNQEVINHGTTGLLFKTNDGASLTRQLTQLVNDPAL
jgi:glycosyltransferase involved in cell wall biosynthesis